MARIRSTPEDFVVDEIPLYEPSGVGEHCFVHVEKRDLTTEAVVRALAREAGARPRDVGYAGRKDRAAVTRQWLSVPGVAPERLRDFAGPGFRVLDAVRHGHKLRTGQLAGNRFEIVVHDAPALDPERLAAAREQGLPNRFGAQRFGRGGRNPEQARRLLAAGAPPPRDRRAARFLLSALQAEVFNAVLAERPLPLAVLEAGDVALVHRSGGLFVVEDPEAEAPRAAGFEISPTGPIFGTKVTQPAGDPARREAEARQRLAIPADAERRLPRGLRLRGSRRSLRVRPEGLSVQRAGLSVKRAGSSVQPADLADEPGAADSWRLRFTLPPGSYASVVLEELYGASLVDDTAAPLAYPAPESTREAPPCASPETSPS